MEPYFGKMETKQSPLIGAIWGAMGLEGAGWGAELGTQGEAALPTVILEWWEGTAAPALGGAQQGSLAPLPIHHSCPPLLPSLLAIWGTVNPVRNCRIPKSSVPDTMKAWLHPAWGPHWPHLWTKSLNPKYRL